MVFDFALKQQVYRESRYRAMTTSTTTLRSVLYSDFRCGFRYDGGGKKNTPFAREKEKGKKGRRKRSARNADTSSNVSFSGVKCALNAEINGKFLLLRDDDDDDDEKRNAGGDTITPDASRIVALDDLWRKEEDNNNKKTKKRTRRRRRSS